MIKECIIIYLFVLISVIVPNLVCSQELQENKELSIYNNLQDLHEKGAFNKEIYLQLEKHALTEYQRIAYLRQAMVFDPRNSTIREKIFDVKQSLNNQTSPKKINQKESWVDYFSLKSYLPFYLIDWLLILSFLMITFLLFYKKYSYLRVLMFFLLPTYLIFDDIFITYTRDGSLRIINSFSDIYKTEAIVLEEIRAFASPDEKSQVTAIVKPGTELDFYLKPSFHSSQKNSWVKIGFENGRSGWYKNEQNKVFIIRR